MFFSLVLKNNYINNKINFLENEIRPDKFEANHDIVRLIDVGLLLSKRKKFVNCPCPACSFNSKNNIFTKRGINYVQCQQCKTLYINPRPSPEILKWFYQNSENYTFWNKFIYPTTEASRRKKIIIPRVERILKICHKYKIKTNSLIEIGAGDGSFCLEMKSKKKFKRIIGIEPTPSLSQTCLKKGLTIIQKPIEEINFRNSERFDIAVSFEVIEHLFSPRDFLVKIKSILKHKGILIFSCPNGMGFDIQTLGKISKTINHEHLNYFNPQSISLLLEKCGYKIMDIFTPGKLDAELVRKEFLKNESIYQNQPFLKRILIDDWVEFGESFQKYIEENNLSSSMWVVARMVK